MLKPDHYSKLERMYLSAPINGFFIPDINISQGKAEISMTIREDFFHAAHGVHGAVYFKALDDAAYFAASSLVFDVFILTVSFSTYFTRPISHGIMNSIGEVVHNSRRIIIAESRLFNLKGHVLARGSGTFMRSRIPLDADVGYL